MAHMSQEKKKEISAKLKPIIKKYDLSGTLSVDHHSTLVFTISRGPIDFISDYNKIAAERNRNDNQLVKDSMRINEFWYKEFHSGKALECLSEIIPIMNDGNHNNSDPMSDYFDIGWYIEIQIGKWNKPYQLINQEKANG